MKKSLIIFISLFLLLVLNSCTNNNNNNNNKQQNDYDLLYHYGDEAFNVVTGLGYYSSIYGYYNASVQGYNGWKYLVKQSDNLSEMNYNEKNKRWEYEGLYMENDIIKVTSGISAIRSFTSTVSGKVLLTYSLFVKEGSSFIVNIYLNNNLINSEIITTSSKYTEIEQNINTNDVIDFEVVGEGIISFVPAVDFTLGKETSLHHTADGYYGDVHPFYDENTDTLYMYYLSTGKQTKTKTVPIFTTMLTTSSDLIHFKDEKVQMKDGARPEQDLYFVLNVYKDKDGIYRSSPGANLHACCSKSTDLLTWENGNEFSLDNNGNLVYGFCTYFDEGVFGGRDPDTFYDKDTDSYYTVVINYYSTAQASGAKGLAVYKGNGQGIFSTKAYKAIDFTGKGDPECPQIKKINNRWYIFYSEYGNSTANNVGRLTYRFGEIGQEPMDIDWNSLEEHYIDGDDLHAAQVYEARGKYYYYGWLNYAYNSAVWGGYLNLSHEIKVADNGILYSQIDEKMMSLLNKGLIKSYQEIFTNKTTLDNVKRNIVSCDIKNIGNICIGNFELGIRKINNKTYIYASSFDSSYNNLLEIEEEDLYHMNFIIDNEFIDIEVNNKYTISTLLNISGSNQLVIDPKGNEITNVNIYKLASLENIY